MALPPTLQPKQTGIEVPKEEQQNVSYQRRAPKPIAPPPVRNVPSPTVEHSKVNQDVINKDNHQNNRQGIYQDSHQNNVVQSDQNYIDQPSYDDNQGYENFPPLEAYDSASYSMDSYSSEPYTPNHADDSGYPPAWLTDTDTGAGMQDAHGIEQSDDKDGNLYELLEQIQQFYQHNLTTHPHAKHYFLSCAISIKAQSKRWIECQ